MNPLKERTGRNLYLLLLTSFIVLTFVVYLRLSAGFDRFLVDLVSGLGGEWIFIIMRNLTYLGGVYFLAPATLLVIFIFWKIDKKGTAYAFTALMLGVVPIYKSIKLIFGRTRPTGSLIEVGGYSYPSGHSLSSFTFFVGFMYFLTFYRYQDYRRELIVFGMALAGLVGFTRIYLSVHYLTDVLGAFLLGSIWVMSMTPIEEKIKELLER